MVIGGMENIVSLKQNRRLGNKYFPCIFRMKKKENMLKNLMRNERMKDVKACPKCGLLYTPLSVEKCVVCKTTLNEFKLPR